MASRMPVPAAAASVAESNSLIDAVSTEMVEMDTEPSAARVKEATIDFVAL